MVRVKDSDIRVEYVVLCIIYCYNEAHFAGWWLGEFSLNTWFGVVEVLIVAASVAWHPIVYSRGLHEVPRGNVFFCLPPHPAPSRLRTFYLSADCEDGWHGRDQKVFADGDF